MGGVDGIRLDFVFSRHIHYNLAKVSKGVNKYPGKAPICQTTLTTLLTNNFCFLSQSKTTRKKKQTSNKGARNSLSKHWT